MTLASKLKSRFKIGTLIKALLTLLVVYFAGKQLVQSWDEVVAYPWSFNFSWLLASFALHLLAFVLFAQTWCYVTLGFGYKVSLKHGFKLAYVANLGRYLPGRVWTIFGMAYLARRVGLPETVSIASYIMAVIFSLPTAFLTSALVVFIHPEIMSGSAGIFSPASLYIVVAASLLFSLLLLFAPDQTLYLVNIVLRIAKRKPIQYHLPIRVALKVYASYLVSWLVFGTAFWCFLKGILGTTTIPFTVGAGAYVFAYQIGFIAIFSPGGIGVRELAITAFLSPYVGAIAAGVAVAARVWNIISEIIAAISALAISLPNDKKID